MALTPQNEQAFLREVDEEVRKEQIGNLFRRYAKSVLALLILGLAAFGGFLWWQAHRETVAGEQGEALTQALRDIDNNAPRAQTGLQQLVRDGEGGYGALAKLTLADVALKKNDLRGATRQYRAIADDAGAPQLLRDLALVRATAAEFDSLPPQAVVDRLKQLAVPGNPWFGSAGEMVALSYLKLNKRDLAGSLIRQLVADETVPTTIRSRAQRLAGSLGIDAVPAQPAAAGGE